MDSYLPLYLKHRPQTLGELVGQGQVVRTLTNAIENDRIAHAYLFTGPRGCGKTSSARILAKSINCQEGPTATPCMVCPMCEEIKKGVSPAVLEIDAASNNSVDDARTLIERAPLVAQGGRFKLYIIDECHMLTKEAFNALLKTIEEPPPRVIFVLATTEEHKVPPTIISRCQRLMFRLANHEELAKHLRKIADIEGIAIEDEALELLARRSGGGLRDALGLLDQASLLASPEKPATVPDLLALLGAVDEDVLIRLSEAIGARDASQVLVDLHVLLSQGREPSLIALELSKHFLNLAKAHHLGPKQGETLAGLITGSRNYIERCLEVAKTFQATELTQMVERLDSLEANLRRTSQPSLSLESGLLSLCHRHDILLIKELTQRISALEASLNGTPAFKAHGNVSAAPPPSSPRPSSSSTSSSSQTSAPAPQQTAPQRGPAPIERPAPEPVREAPPHYERGEEEAPRPEPKPEPREQARPAPVMSATTPQEFTEETAAGFSDVDEFWSRLMDYLQTKHLPTYSVVSQFGFPLSLSASELVIGVPKENLQKLIENKAENLKKAIKNIDGRDLFIKVKVTAQDSPAPPKPTQKQDNVQPRSQEREFASSSNGTTKENAPEESEPPGAGTLNVRKFPTAQAQPNLVPAKLSDEGGVVTDGLMVKEAYKLFEGPGSRLIGQN